MTVMGSRYSVGKCKKKNPNLCPNGFTKGFLRASSPAWQSFPGEETCKADVFCSSVTPCASLLPLGLKESETAATQAWAGAPAAGGVRLLTQSFEYWRNRKQF